MNTIPQGTQVRLKHDIQFPNPLTGRYNQWKTTGRYWIGSSEVWQTNHQSIEVCKRNQPMGTGMRFSMSNFAEHFDVLHEYVGLGNTICDECGNSLNHPTHIHETR